MGYNVTGVYGGEEDQAAYGGEEDQAAYGDEEDQAASGGEEDQAAYGDEEDQAASGGEEDQAASGGEEDQAAYGGEEDQAAYGLLVRGTDSDYGSPDSTVCSFRKYRLMFEDPRRQHPCPCSTDSYKIRTDCRIPAGLSRVEVDSWLADESDGKKIPAQVREHILNLVFDSPNPNNSPGFDVWFDLFYPGRNNPVVYWFDEILDPEDGDGEEEVEEERDGNVAYEVINSLKREEITEESGCTICGVEKAEIGTVFMWMPCGHSFHVVCIHRWLLEHCYCPVCNYRLPIETYEEHECVCMDCLINFDYEIALTPNHPPPYLSFYN